MVSLTVEIRAQGENLLGTILQEGRAASGGRAEVFAPGSLTWPADGIAITDDHGGPTLARAFPHRGTLGEIQVRARATEAIRAAIGAGKKYMSVEFRALDERITRGKVREITRAFVDAAALVATPEYDTTSAEVRGRARRRIWL